MGKPMGLREKLRTRLRPLPRIDVGEPVGLKDMQPADDPAIERYLNGFHWAEQKTPGVHEALVNLASSEKKTYQTVKCEMLVAAVKLVLTQKEEAQPIRIGAKWVGSSRTPVIPLSLDEQDFAAWLRQETHKAANALALGRPYPDTGADEAYHEFKNLADHVNSGDREWNGKKEMLYLLAGEGGSDDDDEPDWDDDDGAAMYRLLEELPERERSLLASLEQGKSFAQIARETGRSAGAVRTEWGRLKPHLQVRHGELRESIWQREPDEWDEEEESKWELEFRAIRRIPGEVRDRWKELCEQDPHFVTQERLRFARRYAYEPWVLRIKQLAARKKRLGPDHFSEGIEQDIRRCREQIDVLVRRQWIHDETDRIRRKRFPEWDN